MPLLGGRPMNAPTGLQSKKSIKKRPPYWVDTLYVGISLFFRAVTSQVFSAPLSLTSVFGMGTGGPSASSTPTILLYIKAFQLLSPFGDSCGNRTRVAGVRGRSLNRLTNEPCLSSQRLMVFALISPCNFSWCTIRGSNPGHPD